MNVPMIARPSVASLLLFGRVNGNDLSNATGFIVSHGDQHYLVTNWHVATGRRTDNGTPLSPTAALPDELGIVHNVAGSLGNWDTKLEPLYDEEGQPLWLEHPQHARNVDVVALPLTNLDGVEIIAHDPFREGPGIAFGVGGFVSIIGFPFGVTGGGAMGVWVQGAVATEPAIDFNELPCFLVDSRTRPGQSGSPVIIYSAGGAVAMQDGGTAVMGGPAERFLGVYSGRISEQSDLGFVWRVDAVREIIEGGQRGGPPTSRG